MTGNEIVCCLNISNTVQLYWIFIKNEWFTEIIANLFKIPANQDVLCHLNGMWLNTLAFWFESGTLILFLVLITCRICSNTKGQTSSSKYLVFKFHSDSPGNYTRLFENIHFATLNCFEVWWCMKGLWLLVFWLSYLACSSYLSIRF